MTASPSTRLAHAIAEEVCVTGPDGLAAILDQLHPALVGWLNDDFANARLLRAGFGEPTPTTLAPRLICRIAGCGSTARRPGGICRAHANTAAVKKREAAAA